MDNVQLEQAHPAVGRTLREIDIRNKAGASVIAIVRDGSAMTNPGPDVALQADDIVVLLGSHAELDRATALLTNREPDAPAAE